MAIKQALLNISRQNLDDMDFVCPSCNQSFHISSLKCVLCKIALFFPIRQAVPCFFISTSQIMSCYVAENGHSSVKKKDVRLKMSFHLVF